MTYLTPEANELEKKAGELAGLKSLLSQKELELTTLKTELLIFERKYLQIVGVRLATLDELEAQIAAILLQENPNDELMREQANQARSQAENSAHAAKSYIKHDIVIPEFAPTDELKRLYREIAKQVHPDLAESESDRELRNRIMSEVNQAFQKCDEKRLQEIIEEWQLRPESVKGDDVGAKLVRTIRKLAQIEGRLKAIEDEFLVLAQSDLYKLHSELLRANQSGRDLLTEMAANIDNFNRYPAETSEKLER